jgi:hypothetical protein
MPKNTPVDELISEISLIEEEQSDIEITDLLEDTVSDSHIDLSEKWCVYLSTHPLGFYYFGKGITENVVKGSYKGSGASLRASWEWYPKDEWSSSVIQTFGSEPLNDKGKDPGELKAYAREKEIIKVDMLFDPFCLNDSLGGGGVWGQGVSVRAVERRRKSVKESWDDPAIREKHRLGALKQWESHSAREKHREAVRQSWIVRKSSTEFQQSLEETKILKKIKLEEEKNNRIKNRSSVMEAARTTLSEKAKKRGLEKRQARYSELEVTFEKCLDEAVFTKDNILNTKATLEKFIVCTSLNVALFNDWLDDHDIIRWGSEKHKDLLRKKANEKKERMKALEFKKIKIFKLSPETRNKMKDRQLGQLMIACEHCNRSFKPAAIARYHGTKCKLKVQE